MKQSLKISLIAALMLVGMTQVVSAVDTEGTETTEQTPQSRAADAKAMRKDAADNAKANAVSVSDRKAAIQEKIAAKKQSLNEAKCERNQERITKMMSDVPTGAQTQLNVLDTMYERVASFYEEKDMYVENYQNFVDNIEQAKVEARNTLQVMQNAEVNVDCAADGMGDQLALYRGAVDGTKTQIREYRDQLVDLISAMKSSAAADDTTDTENTEVE